jgi:hypothetical protein
MQEKAKFKKENQMMRAMLLESIGGEGVENNFNNFYNPNPNSNFTNTPAGSKSRGGMNPHQ